MKNVKRKTYSKKKIKGLVKEAKIKEKAASKKQIINDINEYSITTMKKLDPTRKSQSDFLVDLLLKVQDKKVLVLDRPFRENPEIVACLFIDDVIWTECPESCQKMVRYNQENYYFKIID